MALRKRVKRRGSGRHQSSGSLVHEGEIVRVPAQPGAETRLRLDGARQILGEVLDDQLCGREILAGDVYEDPGERLGTFRLALLIRFAGGMARAVVAAKGRHLANVPRRSERRRPDRTALPRIVAIREGVLRIWASA